MDNSNSEICFKNVFRKGKYKNLSYLTDAKLLTEDGRLFKVHRIVLAKKNNYFRSLFHHYEYASFENSSRKEFFIPNIRGSTLEQILCHIYTGSVQLTNENVCDLLVASDYLLVDNLVEEIKEYARVKMSADNCIPLYVTASDIGHDCIRKLSYRFIQTNFERLVWHDDFGDLPAECLRQFLGDPNLGVRGEHVVWFAIAKWAREDERERLRCVPELLKCLKLADVSGSLAERIVCDPLVSRNPFCDRLKIMMRSSQGNTSAPLGLDALMLYFAEAKTASSSSTVDFYGRRVPARMHVIVRYLDTDKVKGVELYATYDENVDIWRRLADTEFCPTHSALVGNNVYLFDSYAAESNPVAFNLRTKRWKKVENFRKRRVSYATVQLRSNLFVIGGEFQGQNLTDVEVYSPATSRWRDASPMMPACSYAAVAFRGSIFVVGKKKSSGDDPSAMLAQIYDEASDTWSAFEPPGVLRCDFTLVGYHDKLYIIGGSDGTELIRKVEVFDPRRTKNGRWEATTELPHPYFSPKTVVLNEHLVVFDSATGDPGGFFYEAGPPLLWKEAAKSWEPLPQLKNLGSYLFHTIDDNRKKRALVRENIESIGLFQKSPFFN